MTMKYEKPDFEEVDLILEGSFLNEASDPSSENQTAGKEDEEVNDPDLFQ